MKWWPEIMMVARFWGIEPERSRECEAFRRPLCKAQFSAYTELMEYQNIITIEPGKRGGKPCIRGMRITVHDVLSYLTSGMTHQQILADFPYFTEEDILACLSYAADRERQQLVVNQKCA
jgi:uncharacterized protein (DUF433 family)